MSDASRTWHDGLDLARAHADELRQAWQEANGAGTVLARRAPIASGGHRSALPRAAVGHGISRLGEAIASLGRTVSGADVA